MKTLEQKVKESIERNKGNDEAVAQEFKHLSNTQYDKVLEILEQDKV